MKAAKSIVHLIVLALAIAGFVSCGDETVAGKTTTTTNGGGVLALGPDGSPIAGCIALAARGWDPVRGIPGSVDTAWSDSNGVIALPQESYLFVEIRDGSRRLGSRVSALQGIDEIRQVIRLDTLRRISGRWPDRSGIAQGRLFLDSSFHSAALVDDDGAFVFEGVPEGVYSLILDAESAALRRMGVVRLERENVRFEGSGNVVLVGDTTGSPLWIDDFEAGSFWPMLHSAMPTVSPWFVWSMGSQMSVPGSGEPDSIPRAIGPDSSRPGSVFTARFATTDPAAQVAVGITNMQLDLRSRDQVCFAYRTDDSLRIEFQRDSVAGIRPTLSTSLPPSVLWRDTCARTSAFVPNSDTPDSLAGWNDFARRVLVIQFGVGSGSSFLGLDDIRMR